MRLILQVILVVLSINAFAADLNSIKFNQQPNKIIIEISSNGTPLDYKAFSLPNPDRVILDFKKTNLKANVQRLLPTNDLIAHVRSGKPNPYDLRLVFDMKAPASVHAAPTAQGLRVEIIKNGKALSKVSSKNKLTVLVPKAKPIANSSIRLKNSTALRPAESHKIPVRVEHSPARNLRDVVVVLDPGHGGKDPGAMGPKRNAEKNVTLSIALKLKRIIDNQPGMRAVLTRKGDYYVGLRERLNIARKYNGDVFISIHADAFINQHSSGASVFALSQMGATSEAARWLAEKENYSELGGVNLYDLNDKLVRTVLIDLSQTATIGASLQMGNKVLRNLDQITNLHNNKVEQARFVVLKSPDIPSILIETGFITNPREERNLTSPAYQSRLTLAILEGIKRYFWEHPPQGTRIESLAFRKM
jgi:N-acetylmuramoyl-L-alanine amidase